MKKRLGSSYCYGAVGTHSPLGITGGLGKGSEALTRPSFHQYHSNFGSGSGIVFRVTLRHRDIHTPCEKPGASREKKGSEMSDVIRSHLSGGSDVLSSHFTAL